MNVLRKSLHEYKRTLSPPLLLNQLLKSRLLPSTVTAITLYKSLNNIWAGILKFYQSTVTNLDRCSPHPSSSSISGECHCWVFTRFLRKSLSFTCACKVQNGTESLQWALWLSRASQRNRGQLIIIICLTRGKMIIARFCCHTRRPLNRSLLCSTFFFFLSC